MILNGLSEISEKYDHFILDIFGVIHNGIELFPDTVHTLEQLKANGKQACLLSNSPRRAEGASSQMEVMGLPRNLYNHIVTSGEATYLDLEKNLDNYGHKCWVIGSHIAMEVLENFDITPLSHPQNADFILNSVPGIEAGSLGNFQNNLKIAAAQNLPMICSNPDLVVNVGAYQYECAGAYALQYEELGGSVIYHGKPHAPVYERCMHYFGNPDKSKVIAIGDAFHTDIAGASNFGIDSILNLTGIHETEVSPDGVLNEALLDTLIESKKVRPNHVMTGFRW